MSSIDAAKSTIVAKRPTEVAQTVHVNDKTTYRSEDNRPIHLTDLRAGDTPYIRLSKTSPDLAQSIRKGPMTVEEVRGDT